MVQLTSIQDLVNKPYNRRIYNKRGIRRNKYGQFSGKRRLINLKSPGTFHRENYGFGFRRNNLGVLQYGSGKKRRTRRKKKY